METFNLPSQETNLILSAINARLAPCTAYVVGYRADGMPASALGLGGGRVGDGHCFEVVVFGDRGSVQAAADVANVVKERSGGAVRVTVLVHNVTQLNTTSACRRWFFWHVVHKGRRICLDRARVPYLLDDGLPLRDMEAVRSYWLKCEAVAGVYLEGAGSGQLEVELVKVAMLHTAVYYVALGLVRVFMGYAPGGLGLGCLLDLCGHFTGLVVEVFPQETEEQEKLYKMLCAPPSMLRHWSRLGAAEADFVVLAEGCRRFFDGAGKLALDEIARLENNNLKTIMV